MLGDATCDDGRVPRMWLAIQAAGQEGSPNFKHDEGV